MHPANIHANNTECDKNKHSVNIDTNNNKCYKLILSIYIQITTNVINYIMSIFIQKLRMLSNIFCQYAYKY